LAASALTACLGPTLLEVTLDAADCVAHTAAEIADGDFVFLQASINAGRVQFNAAQIDECVADYTALGCDFLASRPPSSCKMMLDGQVPLDGQCVLDDDCIEGLFCDRSTGCPGTCETLRASGGDCDRNDQCQDGLQCLGGECGMAAMDNQSCGGGVATECHLGLVCIGEDPTNADMSMRDGTCMTRAELLVGGENEPCDPPAGEFCEEGLACVVDYDAEPEPTFSFVCLERVAAGDECHASILPQQCPAGQYCPADLTDEDDDGEPYYLGECIARPTQGQPCGAFAICAPDHYCDQTTERCRKIRRLQGEPCELDGHCLSQRCEEDADGDGSHCVALDRCRLDAPSECGDEECSDDESCESCEADCGECTEPTCGDNLCNGTDTCSSCEADCGECPEPECGNQACDGEETCATCEEDCGQCPDDCGDDECDGSESCESCREDCGACPAPYSGPCDTDAECAPDQSCELTTVPGPFGIGSTRYGYCAESCNVAADCSERAACEASASACAAQRVCTSEDLCALECDLFACAFDPSLCCDWGAECVQGICTWLR
jgi:hypothetical protein